MPGLIRPFKRRSFLQFTIMYLNSQYTSSGYIQYFYNFKTTYGIYLKHMPKSTIVSRKILTVNQLVTYINECSFWTNWWFARKILIFKRTFYFVDFAHLYNIDSNLMKKWKIWFFFSFSFFAPFFVVAEINKIWFLVLKL